MATNPVEALKAEYSDKEIAKIAGNSYDGYGIVYKDADSNDTKVLFAFATKRRDGSVSILEVDYDWAAESTTFTIPTQVVKYLTPENCERFDDIMTRIERRNRAIELLRKSRARMIAGYPLHVFDKHTSCELSLTNAVEDSLSGGDYYIGESSIHAGQSPLSYRKISKRRALQILENTIVIREKKEAHWAKMQEAA